MRHAATWVDDLMSGDADALRRSFPMAALMAETPQDPVYHAEGDVWAHTLMVMAEARAAEAGRGRLGTFEGAATLLAALLHDVAKPQTLVREFDPDLGRERLRNPSHASRGAALAWRLMSEARVPIGLRYRACHLIAWHHRPAHLCELSDQDAMMQVLRLSATGTPWRDLTDFCRHDNRGRICPDPEEAALAFDLADYAAGLTGANLGVDLLDAAPEWSPEFRARIGRQTPELHLGHTPPHKGRLIIMSGLPGSGKSAWVSERASVTGAAVISADAIRDEMPGWERNDLWEGRVFQEFDARLRRAMAGGGEVIADGTFLGAALRQKFISMGHDYGMRVGVVLMDVTPETAMLRNAARANPVPDAAMRRFAESVAYPQPYGIHDLGAVDEAGDLLTLAGDLDAPRAPEMEP